eukprot:5401923-Heterocapsa_arctica.AAC.1
MEADVVHDVLGCCFVDADGLEVGQALGVGRRIGDALPLLGPSAHHFTNDSVEGLREVDEQDEEREGCDLGVLDEQAQRV